MRLLGRGEMRTGYFWGDRVNEANGESGDAYRVLLGRLGIILMGRGEMHTGFFWRKLRE